MHAPQGPWVPLTQPHPRALQEHPLPTPGHHFLSQGMHPLPGPLRPLPETLSSTPQTQLGERGQECGSPETTPCLEGPGTLDCLSPYKVLAPAPSDPTCRVSPLGRCPRPLCPDPRRTPGLDTVSLHCPHADRALRPGVPASMRSESPLPHPWQTTRSKVTGRPLGNVLSEPWVTQGKVPRFPPGRRDPPPGRGSGLTGGVPGGLAPGPGGGGGQDGEEQQRRRGRHGGRPARRAGGRSDVALRPGRSRSAPAPRERGVGLQRSPETARGCGRAGQISAQPASAGPVPRPRARPPPGSVSPLPLEPTGEVTARSPADPA